MTIITLKRVTRADAVDLINSNIESRAYHDPWVRPFTDLDGFKDWFEGLSTGANVSLVARHEIEGRIIGVINISQIFLKGFQSAYLGYYGMIRADSDGSRPGIPI